MQERNAGIALAIGLLIGMALALTGCSVKLTTEADVFYPKDYEPREVMPWYGSVGGKSHGKGVEVKHFNDSFKRLER